MRVIYAGQLRDITGYGVAARGYLKALDTYLEKHPGAFELRAYSAIAANSQVLDPQELSLIEKYEFKTDEEIQEAIRSDYTLIWHVPPPMPFFADERFRTSGDCTPSLKRLVENAKVSVNFTVWETDTVPIEWKRDYEYFKPDLIVVPCEWNKKVFEAQCGIRTEVVPHVVEDTSILPQPINLPVNLSEKFVVFTMSQWTKRKGFDRLVQAYSTEFGDQEDTALVIKTYGSATHNQELIANEIKYYRSSFLLPGNKRPNVNNIILIPDFMKSENVLWLNQQADVFALLSRGEGFGLPIAESLILGKPVVVPREGGHVDYIDPEAAFFVDGEWDSCTFDVIPYDCNMNWYECSIRSARKALREAYELWKNSPLKLQSKGLQGRNHILQNGYSSYDIGKKYFEILKSVQPKKVKKPKTVKDRRQALKKKLIGCGTLEEKVEALRDSFKGETCYVLATGPSLADHTPDELREKIGDGLVLSIKQAYNMVPDITDFHFFNCANMPPPVGYPLYEHYRYNCAREEEPIIVASSNYALGQRWHSSQKHDLFFKIPIRTEIDDKFLCKTKEFEKYILENGVQRPCGPGIMCETVLYTALHLGVSKIIAIGYDYSKSKSEQSEDHEHFYGDTNKLYNQGDILSWEMQANIDSTKELYEWLKNRNVDLEVASQHSLVYSGIPRVTI